MSVTGGISIGLPILPFQKRVEFGDAKSKIVSFFSGRARSGAAKVSQDKASGNVVARAKGAKTGLNLTALYRASAKPAKVPSNGGAQPGVAASATATPSPLAPSSVRPSRPEPNPAERLTTARTIVFDIRAELPAIGAEHEKARGKSANGLGIARNELSLLKHRDALQAKVTEQISSLDKALAATTDPVERADITATRRSLVSLAVAAEYPQSVAAALRPFERSLPDGALKAMADGGAGLKALDTEARRLLESFRPDAHHQGVPARDMSVLSHLDGLVRRIEEVGADPAVGRTPADAEALSYLKDLRSAIGLAQALHETVDALEGFSASLDSLRERFKDDKDFKDLARPPIGQLCREISHFAPLMHGTPATVREHETVLLTLGAIASEMARTVVPDVFVCDDEAMKKTVSALRTAHCQDLAATKLVGTLNLGGVQGIADALTRARTEGRPVTPAEIRPFLDSHQAAQLDDTLAKGKSAAQNREAYFNQLGRVARAIGDASGSRAAVAYKAGIWLKVGIPNAQGALDPAVPRAIETLRKLGKDNPETAFLVAGLAALERRVAVSDRDVLGLPWTAGVEIEGFDAGRVMAFAGVTAESMVMLGYGADDAASFPDRMERLGRNFDNPAELASHMRYFKHVGRETLTNASVQEAAANFAGASGRVSARRMLNEALGDAAAYGKSKGVPDAAEPHLNARSDAVIGGFRQISSAIARVVHADDALAQSLETGTAVFSAVDEKLVDAMRQRADLEARITEMRRDLAAAGGKGPLAGLDLAAEKPRGLRSAKAILEAVKQDNEVMILAGIGAPKALIDEAAARRDAALDELRGYDAETMRRPWSARIASVFATAERPDIGTVRTLRAAAEGIVFLREEAPAKRAEIDGRLSELAQLRSDIGAARLAEGPAVIATVRQTIRAAVLAHWPAGNQTQSVREGHVVEGYEPSAHRDAIVATLRSWGLDAATFEPEISSALNATLSDHDLQAWASEARRIDPTTGLVPVPETLSLAARIGNAKDDLVARTKAVFTPEGLKTAAGDAALMMVNKSRVDAEFRAEIFALAGSLKDGEKYDFKSGYKITANSGKIPLDPTGTVGIRAKLAVTALSNFVIERSGDSFKLTARGGVQGQIGADVLADQRASFDDRLSAGVSAGLDITGTVFAGVAETFAASDLGRANCADFLLALLNGERPKAELFENLADASRVREYGGKLGANLKAYGRAEFTSQPFGNDGDAFSSAADRTDFKSGAANKLGFGVTASAELAASLGGKLKTTRSHNKVAYESELESIVALSLNAGAYVKAPTALGAGLGALMSQTGAQAAADDRFNQVKTDSAGAPKTGGLMDVSSIGANEPILGIDGSVSLTRTRKAKQEYAISGSDARERLSKAEVVARTDLRLGPEVARLGIGSAELDERLASNPAFKADYQALKTFMGANDALQITYALKPDKVKRANDLILLAEEHSAKGNRLTAALLRADLKLLFVDETNYEPTKVTVFTKTVVKDAANRGNALLARFDVIAESTHEDGRVVLAVPKKTA